MSHRPIGWRMPATLGRKLSENDCGLGACSLIE
jgi:hypothetical protein